MAIDREKILQAAQALVEKKRFDKAIVEYQKLVAVDHKDARTLLKIGELYLKLEQWETAVTTFEQVAQIHASTGFALKAIAAYKQCREVVQRYVPHLSERFGYHLTRIAELYVELKLHNDAVITYEEVATRLEASGRDRDTIDVLRKVVDLDPQNPQRVHRLGEALVRVGDVDGAVGPLAQAAEILFARNQREDALSVAERVLQLRPEPRMARLAAMIYLDRGWPNDGAAALVKIQLCYKQAPKDLDNLDLLAKALYALRQPVKALEVHKEAARIAQALGKMDVFDFHMQTLVSRAPNDEAVRKLAAQWSKAPPGMLEPPAPRRDPPAPPPRAAPPAPPMAHAPQAMPPAPPPMAYAPPSQAMPPAPPMAYAPPPQAMPPHAPPPQAMPPAPPPPLARMTPPQRPTPPTPPPRLTPQAPPQRLTPAPPPQRLTPPTPPPRAPMPQRLTPLPAQPRPIRVPVPVAPIVPDPAAHAAGGFGEVDHFGVVDEPPPYEPPPYEPPPYEPPAHERPAYTPPPYEPPPPHAPPLDDSLHGAPFSQSGGPVSIGGRGRFDEEAIEEVEFFVSQGMFEDALNVLDEQLARLPNHPLLLDRRADVEAQAAAAAAGEPLDR